MISYYQAPYAQKGYGFGGIFRGLTKFISPIASGFSKLVSNPTVQSLAKDAVRTGASIAADAIEGRESNFKEESEQLLRRARKTVADKVRQTGKKRHINKGFQHTDDKNRENTDTDDSLDSDDAYDVSNTPVYSKKHKIKGNLVKKKKRTIFDE